MKAALSLGPAGFLVALGLAVAGPAVAEADGLPATSVQQGQGFFSGMPRAAVPAGRPVRPPSQQPVALSAKYAVPRPASHPGGLGMDVLPSNSPRSRGTGTGFVEIFQRNSPGISARDIRLKLTARDGLKIAAASGSGWVCRPSASGYRALCRGQNVTDKTAPGSLKVTFRARAGTYAEHPRLYGRLTWRERRDAALVAAGLAKPAPRGSRGAKLVRRSIDDYGEVPTEGTLKVKLDLGGDRIQPTGDQKMTTVITGRIDGIEEAKVASTWTQLCTDRRSAGRESVCAGKVAPRARFLQDTTKPKSTSVETMGIDLPDVKKPTQLWFALEARDGNVSARDRIRVIAQPFREAVLEPRLDTLKKLDEIARPVTPESQVGKSQKLIGASISGSKVASIRTGKTRTLQIRSRSRVISTRWTVVRGSRSLLSGSRRSARSITLRPSRKLAARTFVLKSRSRLAGGDTLELAKTVKVMPSRARSRASMTYAGLNSARLRAGVAAFRRSALATRQAVDLRMARISGEKVAGSAAGSPERTLCAIGDVVTQNRVQPLPYPTGPIPLDDQGRPLTPVGDDQIPDLVLGDSTMVWLGPDARLSSDRCDGSSKITFTQAQMRVGESTFIDVDGSISAQGMVIAAGSYRIPAEWATRIPTVRDALSKGLRFTVPGGSRVRANIDPESGEWGAMGGEIELPAGLELLRLPGGWQFKPARLGIETTGLVSLSIEAVAPSSGDGATGGSVLLEGRMDPMGQAEIEVTASNVATIRQANGDQVAFSGGGQLTFTQAFSQCQYDPVTGDLKDPNCDPNDPGSSLTVTPEVWVAAEGKIQLADNFALTRARMLWSPDYFEADMAARAGSEKSFVDFAVGGRYASSEDWNFSIRANSDNWEIVDGLVVERLEGTVTRSKPDADRPGITTIYAKAAARGWRPSPAFEVSTLDASLTNECPKDGVVAKECQTGAVRLNLDVKGKAQLPIEGVGAMDWESVASVNLSTLKFTLYGGVKVPDGGVGPEGLKLREIQINLSNETSVGQCVPRGPPVQQASQPNATLAAEQNLNFSLIAKGTVMGKDANFIGDFGNGLCLIGDMSGGMPADAPYADAGSYGTVKVAYSSFDATFTSGALNYSLDAKRVQLATTFKLPNVVEDTLKLKGTGRFVATVGAARDRFGNPTTGNSFDAEISVDLEKGSEPVVFGERSGSHLGLDSAGLRLVWGAGATSFSAGTQMTYRTAATTQAESSGVSDSQTPFFLQVVFDKTGAMVSGGIDAKRAPDRNDKGEPVVNNAFGVQDMKVYGLAVSLTLGTNTSMGFNADTVLPARWVDPIGIKDGARIALAASVSQTNPCFSFSVSNEKGPEAVAVDLANAGLLSANEMNILLAPNGCVVGDKQIDPGFGFKFNGRIAGSFPLQVEANVQLPSRENPTRFYLAAKLFAPSFELGTVAQFEETRFDLKIDPANSAYLVSFEGGINVLGQTVKANARFESTGGLGNVKLDGRFQANLGVVGFNLDSDLAIKLDMSNYDIKTFGFNADMRLKVLGTTLAGAKAELLYNNGVIEKFNFELTAGINVGIAAAQGTVRVNYNLLRAAGDTQGPFVTKKFKVGFGGKLRFLFWSTPFDWDIYSYSGKLDPGEIDVQRKLLDKKTAEQEVEKLPDLPWVSFTNFRREGTDLTNDTKVTAVAYKVSAVVATEKTVDQKATSDQRGELVLNTCRVGFLTANNGCEYERAADTYTALIDYPNKKIIVKDGRRVQSQNTQKDSYEDVVLEGINWDAMVKWVGAARAEYKKKNGSDLPPMRSWSLQARTSVGNVSYGDTLTTDVPDARRKLDARNLQWNLTSDLNGTPKANGSFQWGRAFRYAVTNELPRTLVLGGAPGRTVPVVGDFDGDGYDDLSQFITPLGPDNAAIWNFRQGAGARDSQLVRGKCKVVSYCQPVEPAGTPFNPTGQGSPWDGSKGTMFPVAGDWDISAGPREISVDDVGIVTRSSGDWSPMVWELWPQDKRITFFTLGTKGDRPVTGDFNGDGVTDVGIYRPPLNVGDTATWYLYDLAKITQKLRDKWLESDQPLYPYDADWTVRLGQYGDMPITGDWSNSGRDGVGVVSYGDRALGSSSPEWKLQDFVDTRCGTEDCPVDHTFRFGSYDSYPIAGKWRP